VLGAALPALIVGAARLAGASDAAAHFHRLVLAAGACAVVGAFVRPAGAALSTGLVGAAGASLAATWGAAHAVDGALLGAFTVGAAAAGLAWGVASLGRALRCPDPGAAISALIVVTAGLTALRWVDPAAERLPAERRAAWRQAVLRADLATAAAYEVAGYDRLHAPDVYDATTIASLPLALPELTPCAAAWASVGVGLGGLGGAIGLVRRRRAVRATSHGTSA